MLPEKLIFVFSSGELKTKSRYNRQMMSINTMIFAKTIVGDKMLYWIWYLCVSWRQFAIYL